MLGSNSGSAETALSQMLGHNSAYGHTLLGKVLGHNGARIKGNGNASVHLRQSSSLVLSDMLRCENHGSDFTTLEYLAGEFPSMHFDTWR